MNKTKLLNCAIEVLIPAQWPVEAISVESLLTLRVGGSGMAVTSEATYACRYGCRPTAMREWADVCWAMCQGGVNAAMSKHSISITPTAATPRI